MMTKIIMHPSDEVIALIRQVSKLPLAEAGPKERKILFLNFVKECFLLELIESVDSSKNRR